MTSNRIVIGRLNGGGVIHRISATLDIESEEIGLGSYVVVEGHKRRYFALVYDVSYRSPADPRFLLNPVQNRLPADLADRVNQRTIKAVAELMLTLCIGKDTTSDHIQPAIYLPPMHAPVFLARDEDLAVLFGNKDDPGQWVIGYTREQSHPVPLNMHKLISRHLGLFGSTGSGKSVLTRILLCGLIKQNLASSLIFDMHNEYAYPDVASDSGAVLPGLKSIFPSKVMTFGLGKHTLIRGHKPDFSIEIALTDLTPGDLLLLTKELNLTDATSTVTSALVKSYGRGWLKEFLRLSREDNPDNEGIKTSGRITSVPAWAKKAGVNLVSSQAFWSKCKRLHRLRYMVEEPENDNINKMLDALRNGCHAVISFGDHETDLDYLLVSNIITRRITELWEDQADRFRSQNIKRPQRLIIVVEEAHKLLNREIASQTIFGTLAREMRKSYVSLWMVDQRPSEISDEILSQIGTRISGWLGDEKDTDAVLIGLPAKDALRRMLTSLQPSGQVLVAGWGIAMPMALRVRWFDQAFIDELQSGT